MTITRLSERRLPEGLFYGVVTLIDGEKVVYEIKGAGSGQEALEKLREHASRDQSLGVRGDGRSPSLMCS